MGIGVGDGVGLEVGFGVSVKADCFIPETSKITFASSSCLKEKIL